MFSWKPPKPENKNESFFSKLSSYLSRIQDFANGIAEKRRLEEQKVLAKEEKRCENFKEHVALIDIAEKISFEKLMDSIYKLQPLRHPPERFRDSPFQGFPITDSEENLFFSILKNKLLSEKEIFVVLDFLFFELDYMEFREKLFTSPAYELLLKEERLINILYENYIYHLRFGLQSNVTLEQEDEIWGVLFKTQSRFNLNEIFKLLKQDEILPLNKLLTFTKKWFETSPTPQDVINTYDMLAKINIKRSDEDRHTRYYILKMAKQNVLSFSLESKYSKPQPEEDIKHFLDYSFSIFSCFHRTASRKIYDKMQKNFQAGRAAYLEEEKSLQENFYKKYQL